MIDSTCLAASFFFFSANLLRCIDRVADFETGVTGIDFYKWSNLDTEYIEIQWGLRLDKTDLRSAIGVLNVVAWLFFTVPMLQVGWILSKGGKEKLSSCFLLMGLAVAGCTVEIVARLMLEGSSHAGRHLVNKYELNDWPEPFIGWKVLELLHIVTDSMSMWVNAFEWISLSGVLALVFVASYNEINAATGYSSFGKLWSQFSLLISTLCWFDFLAEVLRLVDWVYFSRLATGVSIVNTLLFLPIWLLVLGLHLPAARAQFEVNIVKTSEPVV